MVTLISTGTSSGKKGRCDARCYNAKSKKCKCCCGGMNHGAGLQNAAQNTQQYADQLVKRYSIPNKEELTKHAAQGNLFDALKQKHEERSDLK